MLLAELSSGQKTGIALMGAAFIVFALASSILIPRYRPDFPGRHVAAFVIVSAGFFAGMMLVIVFVAKETEEPTAEAGRPPETQPSIPRGNPAAGKALFTAQGCNQCHTFSLAGSKATVGPDLDNLAADAKKADRGPVEKYAYESIENPSAYVVPGYQNGIMPTFGQTLKPRQIADLVAFVTSKSG